MQVFEIPARFVLGMYLLVDNLLPFLFAGEGGVAHGAHIGGFVAGGLVAWLMDRRGLAARPADIEAPEAPPSGAGAVRAALADGRFDDAARAYFALPAPAARGALSAEEAVELASWLRGAGPRRRRARCCCAGWCATSRGARASPRSTPSPAMILLEDRREPTAAYQYLLAAARARAAARDGGRGAAGARGHRGAAEAARRAAPLRAALLGRAAAPPGGVPQSARR